MTRDNGKMFGSVVLDSPERFKEHPKGAHSLAQHLVDVCGVRQERIPLEVHKHRGHYNDDDNYHPNNLLDGKNNTYYFSKKGSPSTDWIEFKVEGESKIYPMKVMIRNSGYMNAIKSVIIYYKSKSGDSYSEWKRIYGIKKGREDIQWFDIDGLNVPFGDTYYIRIEITSNHGNEECNSFREFVLSGYPIEQ